MTEQRVTKTIYGGHGMLYVSCGDTTYNVASCVPRIELIDETERIERLGSGEIIRRKRAEVILTFHAGAPTISIPLKRVDSFGVMMSIVRKDGKAEMVDFPRCRLVSTLDLVDGGASTFEIDGSDETMEKLRRI